MVHFVAVGSILNITVWGFSGLFSYSLLYRRQLLLISSFILLDNSVHGEKNWFSWQFLSENPNLHHNLWKRSYFKHILLFNNNYWTRHNFYNLETSSPIHTWIDTTWTYIILYTYFILSEDMKKWVTFLVFVLIDNKGNAKRGISTRLTIWPADLDLWHMTLKINRVPDSLKD